MLLFLIQNPTTPSTTIIYTISPEYQNARFLETHFLKSFYIFIQNKYFLRLKKMIFFSLFQKEWSLFFVTIFQVTCLRSQG